MLKDVKAVNILQASNVLRFESVIIERKSEEMKHWAEGKTIMFIEHKDCPVIKHMS